MEAARSYNDNIMKQTHANAHSQTLAYHRPNAPSPFPAKQCQQALICHVFQITQPFRDLQVALDS
jgi:hypothetical protein